MSKVSDDALTMPDILARDMVYEGKRINLERMIVRTPNGRETVREVVRHPGAVVILPITEDGKVAFVRNVRVAVDQALLELPAGTLEPPEQPADCAARELIEETGYRAGRIEPLGRFYTGPGFCDEDMHAFVATGLVAGDAAPEAGEQIVVELIDYQDALAMCTDGRLRDGKSIAVLLMHESRTRQGGR